MCLWNTLHCQHKCLKRKMANRLGYSAKLNPALQKGALYEGYQEQHITGSGAV